MMRRIKNAWRGNLVGKNSVLLFQQHAENYTAGPVVRANVRQVSIRKLLESGRDIAAQAMTVKIRLNSDICVGDRILWRGQFYNVLNITTDREERSEILAVELVQD